MGEPVESMTAPRTVACSCDRAAAAKAYPSRKKMKAESRRTRNPSDQKPFVGVERVITQSDSFDRLTEPVRRLDLQKQQPGKYSLSELSAFAWPAQAKVT